jgi:hypothetical protein
VILHAVVYCGVPTRVDGMKIAERVLDETAEKAKRNENWVDKQAHRVISVSINQVNQNLTPLLCLVD